MKHFLSLSTLEPAVLEGLLSLADDLRDRWRRGDRPPILAGRGLAMLFSKPSLRTRISFEVGMRQLGGDAYVLLPQEVGMGARESVADVARVLSRYVDGVMARVFDHSDLEGLAEHASIPIINGLSDRYHPCQALADLLTIRDERRTLAGSRLAYVGDGNNVAHSLLLGGALSGMHVVVVHPEGFGPAADVVARAESIADDRGGSIRTTTDLGGVDGAHVVYTDVWASMGQEDEAEERRARFAPYRVDKVLLERADEHAIVLHCLPAHRGEEITAEVIDSPASRVFDQAENRLHAQKALLAWLMADQPLPR